MNSADVTYPLLFQPILQDKIWGSSKLKQLLNKDFGDLSNCGESWELSGLPDFVSVVINGPLAGQNLQQLIDTYKGDLLGEKVYQKYGSEFPLLIKFINANDDLSVQVHPNDKLARKRHNSFGKTEMWYVMQADPGAKLNIGFNEAMDKEKYLEALNSGKIEDVLNFEEVKPGDVLFMPAGRVHAIGKGVVVAEIQQSSNITYRIFDYNRKDSKGHERELHTELAVDAIDFTMPDSTKVNYTVKANCPVEVVQSDYFTTSVLELSDTLDRYTGDLDSFKIYMCLEGEVTIVYGDGEMKIAKGDTILVPAALEKYRIVAASTSRLLEVYI